MLAQCPLTLAYLNVVLRRQILGLAFKVGRLAFQLFEGSRVSISLALQNVYLRLVCASSVACLVLRTSLAQLLLLFVASRATLNVQFAQLKSPALTHILTCAPPWHLHGAHLFF